MSISNSRRSNHSNEVCPFKWQSVNKHGRVIVAQSSTNRKKEVHFLSVHFGTAQPLKVLNIGSWNE